MQKGNPEMETLFSYSDDRQLSRGESHKGFSLRMEPRGCFLMQGLLMASTVRSPEPSSSNRTQVTTTLKSFEAFEWSNPKASAKTH